MLHITATKRRWAPRHGRGLKAAAACRRMQRTSWARGSPPPSASPAPPEPGEATGRSPPASGAGDSADPSGSLRASTSWPPRSSRGGRAGPPGQHGPRQSVGSGGSAPEVRAQPARRDPTGSPPGRPGGGSTLGPAAQPQAAAVAVAKGATRSRQHGQGMGILTAFPGLHGDRAEIPLFRGGKTSQSQARQRQGCGPVEAKRHLGQGKWPLPRAAQHGPGWL